MSTTQLPMIDAHVHLPEPGAEGGTWGELATDLGASGLERVVLVQSAPLGAARAAVTRPGSGRRRWARRRRRCAGVRTATSIRR